MSSSTPAPRRRRRSRGPRLVLLTVLSVLPLVLLELVLRMAGYGATADGQDPLVGFDGGRPLFVQDASGDWVTADDKRNHFNVQRFADVKPAGTTRVVCLGGSTTYGRPYTDQTSFPGWLRHFLPSCDPSHPWEVINAGGISYASYRVVNVLTELLEHEPDVVLIYTGHNEFLEQRTYGELIDSSALALGLSGRLRRTALFDWASRLVGTSTDADAAADARSQLPAEVTTLLDGSVGPDAYQRDDTWTAGVLAHLRLNLVRMARLCQDAGVPVVFITPASELADCQPFKAVFRDDLPAERRAALTSLLAEAGADRPALEAAVVEDDRQALAWYRLGQARRAEGDDVGARQAFVRARDEDVVPLRATSPIVAAVREVAAQEGLPLLDWVARVDALASELVGAPIPGAELFLDHVHMTIEAYRLLALDLIALLAEQGLVTPQAGWDVAGITAEVLASVDTEAHVRALVRLANVLAWAGKSDEARTLTERALELSGGGDAMSQWQRANYLRADGDLEGAAAAYTAALAIDPDYAEARLNLGEVALALGRLDEAAAAFEALLEQDPDVAEAHFGMGVVLDRRDQRAESRNALRRALKLNPGHADALNLLGVSLLRDGELKEAEQALVAATLNDPGLARAHYNLALLLSASGRLDNAVISYEQALAIEPDNARTWNKLGMARASLDDLPAAITALQRAVDLAPRDERFAQDLERAQTRARFGGR